MNTKPRFYKPAKKYRVLIEYKSLFSNTQFFYISNYIHFDVKRSLQVLRAHYKWWSEVREEVGGW